MKGYYKTWALKFSSDFSPHTKCIGTKNYGNSPFERKHLPKILLMSLNTIECFSFTQNRPKCHLHPIVFRHLYMRTSKNEIKCVVNLKIFAKQETMCLFWLYSTLYCEVVSLPSNYHTAGKLREKLRREREFHSSIFRSIQVLTLLQNDINRRLGGWASTTLNGWKTARVENQNREPGRWVESNTYSV